METAKTVESIAAFVDYAHPTMMAEKALKALHHAALMKDWFEAREQALLTIKWASEAHAALMIMQKEDSR